MFHFDFNFSNFSSSMATCKTKAQFLTSLCGEYFWLTVGELIDKT